MSQWVTAFRKARHEGPRIRQYKSLIGLDGTISAMNPMILDRKGWDGLPDNGVGSGEGIGHGSGLGDGSGACLSEASGAGNYGWGYGDGMGSGDGISYGSGLGLGTVFGWVKSMDFFTWGQRGAD